jgi:hypothetical protein
LQQSAVRLCLAYRFQRLFRAGDVSNMASGGSVPDERFGIGVV